MAHGRSDAGLQDHIGIQSSEYKSAAEDIQVVCEAMPLVGTNRRRTVRDRRVQVQGVK